MTSSALAQETLEALLLQRLLHVAMAVPAQLHAWLYAQHELPIRLSRLSEALLELEAKGLVSQESDGDHILKYHAITTLGRKEAVKGPRLIKLR